MSHGRARHSINALNILKCSSNEVLEICHQSSVDKLRQGQTTRVFDDFPILITKFELDNYAWLFTTILHTITKQPMDGDNPMRVLTDRNKNQLALSIIQIATLGHALLLENPHPESALGHYQVHPELVQLLEWDEFANSIQVEDMLCAFVGKTSQEIIEKVRSDNVFIDIYALNALTDFINKHYREWIRISMDRAWKEKHPDASQFSAATVATAGLTALAILSGLALFGLQQSRGDGHSPSYPPPRSPR